MRSFVVIPHHLNLIIHSFTERRPLKSTLPIPLFRSPSARLIPKDIMEDDRGCASDGLNLAAPSFEGTSQHNEVLHYSFMPNKQIVSFSRSLCVYFYVHRTYL
jgi:hypothetical protein